MSSKHVFPLILDGVKQVVTTTASWNGLTSYVTVAGAGGNYTFTLGSAEHAGTVVTVIKIDGSNTVTVDPTADFDSGSAGTVGLGLDKESVSFMWDGSAWRLFQQDQSNSTAFTGGSVSGSTTFAAELTANGDVNLGNAQADKIEINGKLVQGNITQTDLDAQSGTITAANFLTGVVLHTSVTGAGSITFDSAANLISGLELEADNEVAKCLYINDGNQNVTLNGGSPTGVTYVNNPTIAAEGAATLVVRRTGAAAVSVYII